MDVLRKLNWIDSTGDTTPLYHDGVHHIFSLTSSLGTTVYPARFRMTWGRPVSRDLVHWEGVRVTLYPGEDREPDACGIWTGAATYGEEKYHTFYTGYNYNVHLRQTICYTTSDDGTRFEKDLKNPTTIPNEEEYEVVDWHSLHVFYSEDGNCWWILISGRKKEGPPSRGGRTILYCSKDLDSWEYYRPTYQPHHTNCSGCCKIHKIGALRCLPYSRFFEFIDTIHHVADPPSGSWRTPKMDGIGDRRFYTTESLVNDEGRRFYFAWAHDRARQSNFGEWY